MTITRTTRLALHVAAVLFLGYVAYRVGLLLVAGGRAAGEFLAELSPAHIVWPVLGVLALLLCYSLTPPPARK